MKKIVLILAAAMAILCIVCIVSCNDNIGKTSNMEKIADEYLSSAENCDSGKISILPYGLEFGMSYEEVDEILNNKLISYKDYRNSIVYNDSIVYKDLVIKVTPYPQYYHNELCEFVISFNSSSGPYLGEDKYDAIKNYINSFVDSTFVNIAYIHKIGNKDKIPSYLEYWFKENQYIELIRHSSSALNNSISFINAPTYKKMKKEYWDNYGPAVEVSNSVWDGSVWQVKSWLRNNLKDPKSYEGIEWSPVQSTEDGYMVRHKYRAKNSYGGYVIKNQIFYLDKQGNVINVI